MAVRTRVPRLDNPGLRIRLAHDEAEVAAADRLLFDNYVAEGYWQDDASCLDNNPHLRSPQRVVCVAMDGDQLIGTASLIRDSRSGLPADGFQPEILQQLRSNRENLAEVSALAVRRGGESRNLVLFLFKFLFQYSFYYAAFDRVILVCTPKHARFYESMILFTRLSSTNHYGYVNVNAQLLTLSMLESHRLFQDYYETDPSNRDNLYRFFLVDEHPSLQFPERRLQKRARELDWAAIARLREMPLAV